uniref:Secreted protein n=1 Tax=Poecilia reticulata TaxID=8081 RepID=A0A3P9NQ27_POERE
MHLHVRFIFIFFTGSALCKFQLTYSVLVKAHILQSQPSYIKVTSQVIGLSFNQLSDPRLPNYLHTNFPEGTFFWQLPTHKHTHIPKSRRQSPDSSIQVQFHPITLHRFLC